MIFIELAKLHITLCFYHVHYLRWEQRVCPLSTWSFRVRLEGNHTPARAPPARSGSASGPGRGTAATVQRATVTMVQTGTVTTAPAFL